MDPLLFGYLWWNKLECETSLWFDEFQLDVFFGNNIFNTRLFCGEEGRAEKKKEMGGDERKDQEGRGEERRREERLPGSMIPEF